MSPRKIKFGDEEVSDSVDLNKIVVSKKWKINDTTYYSTIMCYFTSNEWMY